MAKKIAILTFQAGPNNVPLFEKIAGEKDVELTVYFQSNLGIGKQKDPAFGVDVDWGLSFSGNFRHKILKSCSPLLRFSLVRPDSFLGQCNFGIIKELIKNKFDAIILYGWNSFTNILAYFTALFTGTKIIFLAENPLKQEFLNSPFKKFLKHLIFPLFFRFVSAFLYIGEENRKFYEYYGVAPERLFFFPYSVDNQRYFKDFQDLALKKKEIKKELGIKEEVVILFVGRLVSKKNPLDLIKAGEIISQKISPENFVIILVGDGPLREELEIYAKGRKIKNVHFAGFKNKEELVKFFIASDIFVLPSGKGETWGTVINEAMCFDLPLVVSDMVGSAENLVQEGENGFLFPARNIDSLAEALGELILDDKKRKKFGLCSRAIVKDYNFDNDVRGLLAALGLDGKN